MDHTTNHYLPDFLTAFDVANQGEGQTIAGSNLLAAMICSLANVSRPGSGLKDKRGRVFKVGNSLLVSGPHSANLITDQVAIPLGQRQSNTNTYLRREAAAIDEAARRPRTGLQTQTPKLDSNFRELSIEALQNPLYGRDQDRHLHLGQLSEEPARPQLTEQLVRSRIVVTGTSPEQIQKQMDFVHLGRPCVYLGIGRQKDFVRFGPFATALMAGRATRGSMDDSVQGALMITDPSSLLGGALLRGDDRCHWLGQLLWLVDGNAGPEAPETGENKAVVALDDIQARYEYAMTVAWGRRLDFSKSAPTIHELRYDIPQERWVEFLSSMEPQSPGITGTARPLLATLFFGFTELLKVAKTPEGFSWGIEWIEAFAQFLVRRMVNARAAVLLSADHAKRQNLKHRIHRKLMQGSKNTRTIYRHLSLDADHCRSLLAELVNEGLIQGADYKWDCMASVAQPGIAIAPPQIEA